jgi:hypothetical protein
MFFRSTDLLHGNKKETKIIILEITNGLSVSCMADNKAAAFNRSPPRPAGTLNLVFYFSLSHRSNCKYPWAWTLLIEALSAFIADNVDSFSLSRSIPQAPGRSLQHA